MTNTGKREIKFRAFYQGEMVEVGQLDFFTDGQIHVNGELVGCDLMQFTGLHDKNGKEIYEGDILKYGYRNPVVVFKNGCWQYQESYIDTFRLYSPSKKSEVIGNIYENKELFKQRQ